METSDINRGSDRPAMITEIRAWLIVAATFVANLVVVVYWAATLSSDIKNLQYQVADFKVASSDRYTATSASKDFNEVYGRLSDHENRLRTIERMPQHKELSR